MLADVDGKDPTGAFNGGVITVPDMTVHGQRLIPADLLAPIATPVAVFQPGCMDPARRALAPAASRRLRRSGLA
jgi:hypothetical protein